MESPENIPALNLESIASDWPSRKEKMNEMQTQTGLDSKDFEVVGMTKELDTISTSSGSSGHPRLRKSYLSIGTNESNVLRDSFRSSAREIIAPSDLDKHLCEAPESENGKEKTANPVDPAAQETILAENRRLKEVLYRERRYHTKEKNRIRQVLMAIDEALSGLPSRLGRIRLQNQKNLMKINPSIEFRDRGDCEMMAEGFPNCLQVARRESVQFSEGFSDTSSPLVKKLDSLDNLIEEMKTGEPTTIEAVLNNELCAISLLKNAVQYTKQKIDQRKSDSETVSARWHSEQDVPSRSDYVSRQVVGSEDIRKLERYICLQKEAIRVLSLEKQKALELVGKEAKDQSQSEKKSVAPEAIKLKTQQKAREDTQRVRSGNGDQVRPFRMIKELRTQLDEKDKALANLKSKVSRLEAAASNKGTLLENERKKTDELEAKLKIVTSENKSLSMQMSSLQFINNEMKEQMEVLKNEIDILIKENAKFTNNPFDLRKYFEELSDQLQNDGRVKAIMEDADKKLKEAQEKHLRETEHIRTSFERSQKINEEYMRTLKGLILYLHNYQAEKNMKGRIKNSYDRVREILGITEMEMGNLFSGNTETGHKELEDLYEQCCAYVNGGKDCEFSIKLSAWLFDLIKQTMINQNSNETSE